MIQSHEVPARVVEVGGKIKYRVDVQEVVGEESTFYTYEELEFPVGTPTEVCEAKVARHEDAITDGRLKEAKAKALDSITVTTTAGNTFDGHESARNNMMSALMAAELLNETSTSWKLADNTIAVVTVPEVKEALTLAIAAAGAIVLDV